MQPQGAFIVLESTTSVSESIVATLVERLEAADLSVLNIQFPQHNSQASFFTRQAENGTYGPKDQIGPYAESLFEVLGFFDAANQIRTTLSHGGVVIVRNFIGSVMATQGRRFIHDEERRGFYIWLDNMASMLLRIPRPTQTFVLHNPSTQTEALPNTYLELSQLYPQDFKLLDLVRSGQPLSETAIVDLLWEALSPLLPPPHTVTQPSQPTNKFTPTLASTPNAFFTPSTLNDSARERYQNGIEQLLAKHRALRDAVTKYALNNLLLTDLPQVQNALNFALPVATETGLYLPKITHYSELTGAYGQQQDTLRLTEVNPRNELDLIPAILYPNSHLSNDELSEEVSDWAYDKKSKLYIETLKNSTKHARQVILNQIIYKWDVLDNFLAYRTLQVSGQGSSFASQELTPRYGYEVPEIIDQAGASELYEDCFDLSLQLHSQLVESGHSFEAQYITLLGHKARWSFQQSAAQVVDLMEATRAGHLSVLVPIVQNIETKLRQTHPLLFEQLFPNE